MKGNRIARLVAFVCLLATPLFAQATLTVTPLTWNVIGLDSNSPAAGPKHFPVGARVCSNVATASITVNWVWDSPNANVNLRPGSLSSITLPPLAAGTCADAYFEVEINQVPAAFNTTRRYHIAATDGSSSASTPVPRELYVEHLISQSRNSITGVKLNGTPIPAGGSLNLVVGNTYAIELDGGTATQGYNQLEAFINFPNTIFQILSVSTTYSADNSPYVPGPAPIASDKLYADACLWQNDPASPNYLSCVGGDFKAGGNDVRTTYTVKIISGGGTSQTLSGLLYDFSGSSFHYNADFSVTTWIANIIDPTALTISKAFAPASTVAGGTSTLTFALGNPTAVAVSGANFTDALPLLSGGQMVVATPAAFSTSGCGAATFAPVAGATSITFANGSIAANSSCTVSVKVSVPALPTTGTYTNTSNHLFIGALDTGKSASATLGLVTVSPPASSCGLTLAQWNMGTGAAGTTPPAFSFKATDVATATSTSGAGLSSSVIDTVFGNPANSWATRGYANSATLTLTDNDYTEFAVNSTNYNTLTFAFDVRRDAGAIGPASLALYSSTNGATFTPYGSVFTPSNSAFVNVAQIFTNPSNTSGITYFRIYGYNAANNGVNALLYLDNVTIGGCQTTPPPTITKSFSPNPVPVGGVSKLTFVVANPGSSTLNSVAVSDTLPAGVAVAAVPAIGGTCSGTVSALSGASSISVSGVSIAAAASCTVTVDVVANIAGPHTNVSGFVSSTEGGTNTTSTGSAVATLTAVQPPSITKTFSTSPILLGGTSILTLTITNPNSSNALNGVSVTDTYPAGLVNRNPLVPAATNTCGGTLTAAAGGAGVSLAGGAIAGGASCAITVPVTAAIAGSYANVTGAVSDTLAGAGNAASATLVVEAPTPAISLAKRVSTSASGPWTVFLAVTPGTPLFYQFTAENTGDVPFNPFSVSDPTLAGTGADPAGCVWQTPNVPTTLPALPVASALIDPTATCVRGPVTAALGAVNNSATAQGTFAATPYNSAPASAAYIGALPGFNLVKEISPAATGPWASAIGIAAGANVFYKFTIVNTGALNLSAISVTDPLVSTASCTFTDPLLIGQATTCVVGPVVAAGALGSVTPNTAIATGTSGSVFFTPPATASYMISGPPAGLSVTKTDGQATVVAGGGTTYTITLANGGPGAAVNATLTDALPAGMTFTSLSSPAGWLCTTPAVGAGGTISCSIASMASGDSAVFALAVGVGAGVTGGSVLTNTAIASSLSFDPVPANNSASDADTVVLVSDLGITKDDGLANVAPGQTTTYVISVTNNGPSNVTGALLGDPAASGLSKTGVTCGVGCVTPPSIVALEAGNFALPTLAAGASYQINVTATVTSVGAPITNTATIAPPAGATDSNPANNAGSDTNNVVPTADVSMVKSLLTAGPYTVGQSISYSLTAANAGPSTATNVAITDAPVNLAITNVSGGGCAALPCTVPSIASGGSVVVTVVATINAVGAFDNSATVTATEVDPNPANNTDNTGNGGVVAAASADVSMLKTLTTPGPFLAGQSVTYTLQVANAGPNSATLVQVTDTPTNLTLTNVIGGGCVALPCTIPSLASGASVTITVTATINAVGVFDNTATAAAIETDPNPANNTDNTGNGGTAVVTFAVADLAVSKTDGVASVQAGANTTYTITVSNNGPDTAPNASVSDTLPVGMTFVSLSAVGGWSCTTPAVGAGGTINCTNANFGVASSVFSLTVHVGAGVVAGTVLVNTAAVSSPAADSIPGNNSATDSDLVTAALVDLAIAKNGPASVAGNGALSYTLAISNGGPAAADGAIVTDAAVANFTATTVTCGSNLGGAVCPGAPTIGALQGAGIVVPTLPAGGSLVFTVSGTAAATGSITNSGTVAAPVGLTDSNPANNSASKTTAIAATISDLSVQKSGPAQVLLNGQITYTLQVVNLGPGAANGTTVTDISSGLLTPQLTACNAAGGASCPALVLPVPVAGPWTIPTLPAGGAVTFTVTGTAPAAAGLVANSVSVAPPVGISDPNPANNTSQVSTQAVSSLPPATTADVVIIKSGPSAVGVTGVVTYTVVISNAGPAAANGATVTDLPSLNLSSPALIACSTTGGATCPAVVLPSPVAGAWTLPALPAGSSVTLTIAGTAPPVIGTLTNVIGVVPPVGIADPDLGNNNAQAITQMGAGAPPNTADMVLTKTGPGTVGAGALVSYTLTLTNLGPDAADGTTITDVLPAALVSPRLMACVPAGGASCPAVVLPFNVVGPLNVTVPVLPLNGSVTLTVSGTAPSTNTSFTNLAQADPPLTVSDPNLGNNIGGPVVTGVLAAADLVVAKTDGVASVVAGGTTTYTVTVTNNGPSEVTGATIVDTAPAGLTFGTWTCAVSNAGSGGTVTTACGAASGSGNLNSTVTMQNGAVIIYTLPATVAGGATGSITNTAMVTAPAGTTDPAPGNNSATDTDTVVAALASADLAITKTDGVASVNAGGSATYTITITNNGPSEVTGATVVDTAPAALTFGSWTCAVSNPGSGGTVTTACGAASGAGNLNTTVTMKNGAVIIYTVPATVAVGATGSITNTATVTAPAGTSDPTPANNSATDTDSVVAAPAIADLAIAKTNDATSVGVAGAVTYTVTVTNNGPSDVTGATVVDTAPAGVTFGLWTCVVSNPGSGGVVTTACGATSGAGNINTTVTMKAGATIVYTVPATISGSATGSIVNTASVNAPAGITDPTSGNDAAASTITITVTIPGGSIVAVPLLDPWALAVLAILLGSFAMHSMATIKSRPGRSRRRGRPR